jgi:glucokinase
MTTTPCVIALDLGGTMLKAGLVDERGRTLVERRTPSGREDGPEAVVERLLGAIDELRAAATEHDLAPAAVGLVVPGIVDEAAGVAAYSANFGWRDLPLRALVEERAGLPTAFGHDVRAGGLAEGALGAAKGVDDFLFLAVGTGIAGAIVADGRPVQGGGFAGEIGHLVVRPGGPRCGCGARGCLEAVASAAAIAARWAERTGVEATAGEVAARAQAGEPAARAVWDEAVDALADALAAAVTLVAPRLVVVGGGLAEAGAQLIDPLDAALEARLTFQRRPRLARARLGDEAGRLGAALLAWRAAGREPAALAR